MNNDEFYRIEDIRKKFGYKTGPILLFAMREAKVNTLLSDIWNTRLPQKVGRNFLFPKDEVHKVYKKYGVSVNA